MSNQNNYAFFHCHSDASLMDGFAKPKDIVKRAKELGMTSAAISDHGTCSNHVAFYLECQKQKIKPILGIELYCALEPAPLKSNRNNTHMVCWAKNKQGVKDLWRMSSAANHPDVFYYKPRINLYNWTNPDRKVYFGIEEFAKNRNIQAFSGHMGSFLSDVLFTDLFGDPDKYKADIKKAYAQYKGKDRSFYESLLKPNWLEDGCQLALKLQDIFGKDNFFIELQNELVETDRIPLRVAPVIVDCLREISKQTGIMAMASIDAHYATKEQADDQRLMLQINLKETDQTVENKLSDTDNMDVMVFFGSDNFYIHSYDELKSKFTEQELNNTLSVANGIEEYDLLEMPLLPKFVTPKVQLSVPSIECPTDSDKYLLYLAIEGAKRLQPWLKNKKNNKQDYWDRIKHEAKIIFDVGLSDYLLIVWDLLSFCDYRPSDGSFDWQTNLKNNGKIDPIVRGYGRGSVGGSIIAYLLGIHKVDSLEYDLLFSRFFNSARKKDLCDIDSDIEMMKRDIVVDYLRHKYGEGNVGQIITFGRIQGKASIKDIFRVKGHDNGFDIANDICKYIPDESKIADEIQEIRDTGESYGIISWSLDNMNDLQSYYSEYKDIFDQAVRVEGTKRNAGRHASGFVITNKPLADIFPLQLDPKTKKEIVAFDMGDVSKVGGVKIDLLGLTLLDKLKLGQDLVNGNRQPI